MGFKEVESRITAAIIIDLPVAVERLFILC